MTTLESEWAVGAGEATGAGESAQDGTGKREVPGKDAEAPYGRTASGNPRRKPGPRGPRSSSSSSTPRRPATPRTPRKPSMPDYRPGIVGIAQLVAAPLAIAGQRSPVALADAAAITVHAAPIAEGLQAAAQMDARVAAILDRVLQIGPYAMVVEPIVSLVVQLAANHEVIPITAARGLGAMSRDELIEHVTGIPAPAPPGDQAAA